MFVGVNVEVGGKGVFVGAGVLVGVLVGVRVMVAVGVDVLGNSVPGRTTSVNVGGTVGDGVRVTVAVDPGGIVGVIALWIAVCACSTEMGTISAGEQ